MSAPEGLFYVSEAISEDLADRLATFLEESCELFPVPNKSGTVSKNARMVAHYGYQYSYQSGATTTPAEPFPEIIEELREVIYQHLGDEIYDNFQFDQCIINRYMPRQGINAHVDDRKYGAYVVSFTISSGAEMEFRLGSEVYKIYTEPRSMYMMTGPARWQWSHQMRGRLSDPGHGKRGIRYSFTFRSAEHY